MQKQDIHIEDEQGRTLLILNDNGEIAISRFPDMSEGIKQMVIELYTQTTGEGKEKVTGFLNYESDENSFCS